MNETDKIKCPYCLSLDVFDTGDKRSEVLIAPAPIIKSPVPNKAIYECRACGKSFCPELEFGENTK